MKNFLAVFFLILSLSFSGPAAAQLLVEEGKVRLNITPGQTITDAMTVHNTSGAPVKVKVYWEDFTYIPPFNGEKDFFPAGTGSYSCADWINFMPREFILPPHGTQRIDYTINVPANAAGGHYGILFFENSAVQSVPGKIGVSIVTRVGSLFFLETANKDKSTQVDEWTAGEKSFKAKLKNIGNVFLLPQGVYYILDSAGIAVDRGDLEKAYLPPEKAWEFIIPYPTNLPAGAYQIILTFDLEDDVSKVVEADFSVDAKGKYTIKQVRN